MQKFVILSFVLILSIFIILAFTQKAPAIPFLDDSVQAKDYNYLLGNLKGISEELLKQHFELYHGYVKSLNKINTKLKDPMNKKGNASYSEYRALDIARPFANNGVILHELYFSNLTCTQTCPSECLKTYINRDFGSCENYICDLKAAAKSARSGWVITAYNVRDCKIHTYIIDLHDEHVPVGIIPIMVMDMWEHAYTLDYGINKDAYIEAFLNNLDWKVVSNRLETVVK